MMTMATTKKVTPTDRVDRAVASVRAAVGRLIRLLCDEDPATFAKAAEAMMAVGPFAVGPLVAALGRAKSSRDRRVIIGALLTVGPMEMTPVMRALNTTLERDPDPRVRGAARAALDSLIMTALGPTRSTSPPP